MLGQFRIHLVGSAVRGGAESLGDQGDQCLVGVTVENRRGEVDASLIAFGVCRGMSSGASRIL